MRITRLLLVLALMAAAPFLHAQSTVRGNTVADSIQHHYDSVILVDVIEPLVGRALAVQEIPDWQALGQDISLKYGDSYVDRSVTKAKIYYYFQKDPVLFSSALVHYTEAYEDKNNLKLMNKNAKMVLQYSQNEEELKSALIWIKHAVDVEPANATYKATYDGLAVKIKTVRIKS